MEKKKPYSKQENDFLVEQVLLSEAGSGFRGYLQATEAISSMVFDLLFEENWQFVCTYFFLNDTEELLFCKLRLMCGGGTNMTQDQAIRGLQSLYSILYGLAIYFFGSSKDPFGKLQ